jgi:glycerol uptake operon antiterminator
MDYKTIMSGSDIIPATRADEEFLRALTTRHPVIFYLAPDLMNISAKVKRAHEAGKHIFVHLDLAKGIGRDESAIRFLGRLGVDGVISTKASLIKMAKEHGLCTVQRFFAVDSQSITTTLEGVRSSKPDMIEIMPGIAPKIVERLRRSTDTPIIAGGLIETEQEVSEMIGAGAFAISTGCSALWDK